MLTKRRAKRYMTYRLMVKMTLLSYQLLKMFSLTTCSGLKTLTDINKFPILITIRTTAILLPTKRQPFRSLLIVIAPICGWSMLLLPNKTQTIFPFPMAPTFCHQQSTSRSLFRTHKASKWMEVLFRGYNHLRFVNLNASIEEASLELLYLWMPQKVYSLKNNQKKMKGVIIVWTQQIIRWPKSKQMCEVQFLISERKFCSKICPPAFRRWNWNKRARVVICWTKWARGEEATKICRFQPGKLMGLKMAEQDHLRCELRGIIAFQEAMKLQSMSLEKQQRKFHQKEQFFWYLLAFGTLISLVDKKLNFYLDCKLLMIKDLNFLNN